MRVPQYANTIQNTIQVQHLFHSALVDQGVAII